MTSCGMVLPARGTLKRFFFACSPPLRMASGTSLALPRPAPTWPWPSPTTTSAEKEKRRPPFTTLATRLMWTTRSFSSGRSFGLIGAAIVSPCLEFQAALAGALCDGRDPAVVHEAVPVEHDRGDLLLLAFLRHELADLLRQLLLFALAVLELRRERGGGGERLARDVVDHLRIDVVQAAVHREPGALLRALHLLADVRLAAQPQQLLLHVRRGAHYAAPVLRLVVAVPITRPRFFPACGGSFPPRTVCPCPCRAPAAA